MELAAFLSPQRVLLLPQAQSKVEILTELARVLDRDGFLVDHEGFFKEILDRESLMSTGIGLGIGIPHSKSASVQRIGMALAITQEPVRDYSSLDGQPIHFIMMIGAPAGAQREYLQILAKVAFALKSETRRQELLVQTLPDRALEVFLRP